MKQIINCACPTPSTEFHIVDRPGFFGKKRKEKEAHYDEEFGVDQWQECWYYRDYVLPFDNAVFLYDRSYKSFIDHNPEIREYICSFEECYDNDITNIDCGIRHDTEAVPRHIQDVSVRQALYYLGYWFKIEVTGQYDLTAYSFSMKDKHKLFKPENLLQIRGKETNGYILNPGRVPFYRDEYILPASVGGKVPTWVDRERSVETFWQRNKVIITRTKN